MLTDILDGIVEKILQTAKAPMTLPEIERKVADKKIIADTFDVQRSVRRLLGKGQAELTSTLAITSKTS